MKKTKNLMDSLLDEMNKVRELIIEYKSLLSNAGMIGASLMQNNINKAERAIRNNDVVEMLREYENLKSCE